MFAASNMSKTVFWTVLLAVGIVFSVPHAVRAQQDFPEFEDVPLPPELPDPVMDGQPLEPEVTIIRREDSIIEEYRINGMLYGVKVTPVVGPPYYLMDSNGDGSMESRLDDLERLHIPQWVLFSW